MKKMLETLTRPSPAWRGNKPHVRKIGGLWYATCFVGLTLHSGVGSNPTSAYFALHREIGD